MFNLLREAYGENTVSRAHLSEWHKMVSEGRDAMEDERPGRPETMKTGKNAEEVRTLVKTDRHLGIRMIAEELNMDKETVRQILTTKLCAKMVPNNSPFFSWKTNKNTGKRSVLTRSCPM
jgi:hypothetical protein